ncbi:ABC transporter ATP-binding protein [Streptomyces violaceus]|uniref:ABC transporter ATP-binding protein n=1 Tax=Streptomyces violaceus TaxID=1936 RepID=UPI00382C83F6
MKLTVDHLHITLDRKPILREVNLEAAKGDTVGLVGPNGSGKYTLLRTVYRSLRPADGVVRVGDDDVGELSARTAARRTAAVLQDAGTATGLTVTGIVALGRTPHHGLMGRDGSEDRRAVAEAVDRCDVAPFADRDYATLSGGERQRVLLARALAQRPHLLVLDELTNHFDIRARFELLDLIRSTGITTLAVLHDLDLAARLCDHLVVLHEGEVVAAGPVLDVLTPDILRGDPGGDAPVPASEWCDGPSLRRHPRVDRRSPCSSRHRRHARLHRGGLGLLAWRREDRPGLNGE